MGKCLSREEYLKLVEQGKVTPIVTKTLKEAIELQVRAMNELEGDKRKDGYYCPACKNKGFTWKAEFDNESGRWHEVGYQCACRNYKRDNDFIEILNAPKWGSKATNY